MTEEAVMFYSDRCIYHKDVVAFYVTAVEVKSRDETIGKLYYKHRIYTKKIESQCTFSHVFTVTNSLVVSEIHDSFKAPRGQIVDRNRLWC